MARPPREQHDLGAKVQHPEPATVGVSDFLRKHRDAILRSWETRVASEQREIELAGLALRDDIPALLDELAAWLASDAAPETSLVAARALVHVTQRLDQGLSLAQMFHEYRLLRETIIEAVLGAEAAEQERAGASGEASRILRIKELARLNAGLDVVLSQSMEEFVGERNRRAAAERASAAQALRESETSYRALFASMDEGFCTIEVLFESERPVDYRFLQVNPAFEKHTGLANVAGKRVRELVPEHDEHWFETYGRIARTGEPARFENAARALGRIYAVHAFRVGEPEQRRVAVLFSDITERKRAAEELRETDARVHSVTNNLPDTVVYQIEARLDGARHFTYLSGGVASLLGCTAEQAIADASVLYGRFLEEDRQHLAEQEQDALTSLVPFKTESRIRKASGEVGWVYAASAPRRRYDGSIVWDGVIIDITDRKRAEEQIRGANLQLAEADRRKDDFLAMLSHELRNPLAPIHNSLYILDRAAPGGDQARRAKAIIERQVGQLTRIVEDLLEVTRFTRGKLQLQRGPLELGDAVRRAVEDHRATIADAGLELAVQVSERPLWVNGDATRLAQALGNLLSNAIKFNSRDGSVVVSLEEDASQRTAVLRVQDTGSGIEPEMLRRLFEPFTQADRTLARGKGGLGLGLALVKGLVEQHGGEVHAHSEGYGKGAAFTIRLPLIEAPSAADRGGARALRSAGRRVLVIEDNVDAADSLREALELAEHEVVVVHGGPDGLKKAREFSPDVVLCDIGLPGMDGYEVAKAMRADEELRAIHLVALTGYALPEDLAKARDAGFDQHLPKPPSMERLEALLGAIVTRAGR